MSVVTRVNLTGVEVEVVVVELTDLIRWFLRRPTLFLLVVSTKINLILIRQYLQRITLSLSRGIYNVILIKGIYKDQPYQTI